MITRTNPATCPTCLAPAGLHNPANTGHIEDQLQIICATHNFESGMSLWEVQKLLGHFRPTTTVEYLSTATPTPSTPTSLPPSGRRSGS